MKNYKSIDINDIALSRRGNNSIRGISVLMNDNTRYIITSGTLCSYINRYRVLGNEVNNAQDIGRKGINDRGNERGAADTIRRVTPSTNHHTAQNSVHTLNPNVEFNVPLSSSSIEDITSSSIETPSKDAPVESTTPNTSSISPSNNIINSYTNTSDTSPVITIDNAPGERSKSNTSSIDLRSDNTNDNSTVNRKTDTSVKQSSQTDVLNKGVEQSSKTHESNSSVNKSTNSNKDIKTYSINLSITISDASLSIIGILLIGISTIAILLSL